MRSLPLSRLFACLAALALLIAVSSADARTQKPILHGKNWVAITGKPLAASAGARIFYQGGNAVDATCAMLAATSTMWDVLGWGGETQALIYNPNTGKVIGINALGVAPTGATPEFFANQDLAYPPEWGPQSAVTPGTPGGLMVMLAEFGSLSLADVLAPAIEMAEGYPIEASAVDRIERGRDRILEWPYSREVFLPNGDRDDPEGPGVGEIFRQADLKATLEKHVEAERDALTSMRTGVADEESFFRGTTTVQAADKDGWVVSVTPSGGWVPAFIAGSTGVGLSQRMQSFVLDPAENPYNVVQPGQRPRVTLTPSMALKDGKPFISFSVQGGDAQDQNLLQFFLNMVEFGMNVQEAAEGDNFLSYQMHGSFGQHEKEPGRLAVNESVPEFTREQLESMGYDVEVGVWGQRDITSGPINAIFFDRENGAMQGGSSNHGDDYGIAW